MPLLGVKRTCPFALHMSANDPKRTLPNNKRLPRIAALWGSLMQFDEAAG